MGQAKARGTYEERKAAAIKSAKKSFRQIREETAVATQTFNAVEAARRLWNSRNKKK